MQCFYLIFRCDVPREKMKISKKCEYFESCFSQLTLVLLEENRSKNKTQNVSKTETLDKLHWFCYFNTYLYRLSQSKYFNFHLNKTNDAINIRSDGIFKIRDRELDKLFGKVVIF